MLLLDGPSLQPFNSDVGHHTIALQAVCCVAMRTLTILVGLLIGFTVLWLMFMWSYGAVSLEFLTYAALSLIETDNINATGLRQRCKVLTGSSLIQQVVPVTPRPVSSQESKYPSEDMQGFIPSPDVVPVASPGPFGGRANAAGSAGLQVPASVAISVPGAGSAPTSRYSDTMAPLNPPAVSDPNTRYVRRPNPVVNLGPRWCQHCKIIKPDRTHHCRHCGTCVLQFDRESWLLATLTLDHCLWIGRCVGWNNHAVSFLSR